MMNKYLKIIIALFLFGTAATALFFYRAHQTKLTKQGSNSDQSFLSFFQKSQEANKTQTTTATFLAVGDIMLSRNVAGSIAKTKDPLLPFRGVEGLLRSTDFNFGNLESPLSGSNTYNPSGSLVFNAPPAYTAGLKNYNFQVVNLANNHAMDQSLAGIDYTKKFLEDVGINSIGTGDNLDEAWQGKIITVKGIKIGFIGASYSSINDGGKARNNYVARIEDLNRLEQSIADLRKQTDFLVVTMHAGIEYTRTPNAAQVSFAHAAIDDGADIVIGAHPHWIQTIENYHGKNIFYSLGNFIFDQEWSQETKEGLTLKITVENGKTAGASDAASIDDLQGTRLGGRIKQIELIPVIVENYSTPRLATEAEAKKILNKIDLTSNVINP